MRGEGVINALTTFSRVKRHTSLNTPVSQTSEISIEQVFDKKI